MSNGTIENPFIVESASDLDAVRNNLNACYKQTKDIDLSSFGDWIPIDHYEKDSILRYDGNGFKISNMTINGTYDDDSGLFGFLCDAHIKNITLENVYINTSERVGAIAGYASFQNKGLIIENCSVAGVIIGEDYVGGIVGGGSDVDFINCTVKANIRANSYIGGIVGSLLGGKIDGCDVLESVINFTGYDAGGLIGTCNNSFNSDILEIKKSSANTVIENNGYGKQIGGAIGSASTSNLIIENCYFKGKVSTGYSIGGMIGYLTNKTLTIDKCYSTVDVFGVTHEIGGLVGYVSNDISVTDSFILCNRIDASYEWGAYDYGVIYGGASRNILINISNVKIIEGLSVTSVPSPWGRNVTPSIYSNGLTQEMAMRQETYAASGWDFDIIWKIDEGKSYPTLKRNKLTLITCKKVPLNNYRR